jgi:hypothetical protein
MKIGAWIHTHDQLDLGPQIDSASQHGLATIRSYSYDYAQKAAPTLLARGMSLLGGIHVDAEQLALDWRTQVKLDQLEAYHRLGVALEGICAGNELREGGDEPDKKRFTARLSFGLANLLAAYRAWLGGHGLKTPLTYAMEGIVFDAQGNFFEWLWPLIDALDVVGVNLYPMGNEAWFTFGAFEESRRFLRDPRARHDRLAAFEYQLRRLLQQIAPTGKPVILTETGFPSAVGYRLEGERTVIPTSDNAAYEEAMLEFLAIIFRANEEYGGILQALYFYEWRDNLHHAKIWNVEASPIHTAFGLCDREGNPKIDIRRLTGTATSRQRI